MDEQTFKEIQVGFIESVSTALLTMAQSGTYTEEQEVSVLQSSSSILKFVETFTNKKEDYIKTSVELSGTFSKSAFIKDLLETKHNL